jgi:hypothetical protein
MAAQVTAMMVGMQMTKSAKLWRRVEMLVKEDGDSCSICGVAFRHKSQTYAGEVVGGGVAVVGPCCLGRMRVVVGVGIYSKPAHDGGNQYH